MVYNQLYERRHNPNQIDPIGNFLQKTILRQYNSGKPLERGVYLQNEEFQKALQDIINGIVDSFRRRIESFLVVSLDESKFYYEKTIDFYVDKIRKDLYAKVCDNLLY